MLTGGRLLLARHGGSMSRCWRPCVGRSLASLPSADDDVKKRSKSMVRLQPWPDRVGKGVGQVIFLNSPTAGGILLASLAIGDPTLAVLAATGSVASTATAVALTGSQHKSSLDAGLLAYNGCLIGCAAGGFLIPQFGILSSTLWTLLLAPTSTIVSLALPKVTGGVPQWTWAFNAVALSQLLHIQPLAAAAETPVLAPSMGALALSPLVGLSQIFVVNSAATGLGVTVAIASYSPLLATHALMGSTIGCLSGLVLGTPETVAMGLWGYNAALTSMAVGVFFQNTRASWALSAGGALATAGIHGGLAAVFGQFGSPCLTLPFCIAATGCHLLADTLPGLTLATNPSCPEKNIDSSQT